DQGEEGAAAVAQVELDLLLRSRRGGEQQQPEPGRRRAPACESSPRRPASLRHAPPPLPCAVGVIPPRRGARQRERRPKRRLAAPIAWGPRQRRRRLPIPARPRPSSTTVVGSGTTSTFIATVSRPQPALVTW